MVTKRLQPVTDPISCWAVRPDDEGAPLDVLPLLVPLQQAVGGYIEVLRLPGAACGPIEALMDEDGLQKRLHVNRRANRIISAAGRAGEAVVGPVVFCGPNFTSLPDGAVMLLRRWAGE